MIAAPSTTTVQTARTSVKVGWRSRIRGFVSIAKRGTSNVIIGKT